jgi:hypothetical protein
VLLHGRRLQCQWDPRYGARERSGVIRVGEAAAIELLSAGDVARRRGRRSRAPASRVSKLATVTPAEAGTKPNQRIRQSRRHRRSQPRGRGTPPGFGARADRPCPPPRPDAAVAASAAPPASAHRGHETRAGSFRCKCRRAVVLDHPCPAIIAVGFLGRAGLPVRRAPHRVALDLCQRDVDLAGGPHRARGTKTGAAGPHGRAAAGARGRACVYAASRGEPATGRARLAGEPGRPGQREQSPQPRARAGGQARVSGSRGAAPSCCRTT